MGSKKEITYIINENNCHICTSHKPNDSGYPRMHYKNKSERISRVIYMNKYYPNGLPDGIVIRHKCDNPNCINIDHLEEGTKKDNSMDMSLRRRYKNQYEKLYFKATRLLDNYEEISDNQREFARKYNLLQGNINGCLKNKYKTHKGWIFKYL